MKYKKLGENMEGNSTDSNPTDVKKTYPYVYTMMSFKKMIDYIERSGRGPKSTEEFIQLGLSPNPTDAMQCLNVARKFHLMDNDGNLLDRGRLFRLPTTRVEGCQQILEEYFPELNKIVNEHPDEFPVQELREYLIIKDLIKSQSVIMKILLMLKELNRAFAEKPIQTKPRIKKTISTLVSPVEKKIPSTPVKTIQEIDPMKQVDEKVEQSSNYPAKTERIGEENLGFSQPIIQPPQMPVEMAPKARNTVPVDIEQILHIEIDHDWDIDKINLVFDRVERLLQRFGTKDTQEKEGQVSIDKANQS